MNTKLLVVALAVGAVGAFVLVSTFGGGDVDDVIEIEANSSVADATSINHDLPDNIPFYPGATIADVRDAIGETDRNVTFSLETFDSVDDVNTWYRGALSQHGWVVTSDRNVGGYILLRGEYENLAIFTQATARDDLGVTVITQRVQIKGE